MAKQQSETSNIDRQIDDALSYECFKQAIERVGFKNMDDYLTSTRTDIRQAAYREYERLIKRILRNKTKTIKLPEGLCQSNNLNHLFTVM